MSFCLRAFLNRDMNPDPLSMAGNFEVRLCEELVEHCLCGFDFFSDASRHAFGDQAAGGEVLDGLAAAGVHGQRVDLHHFARVGLQPFCRCLT